MNILFKLWNNFKDQPDVWFFFGFLFTSILSVRKIIFYYPIVGKFNEYTSIYLSLSDIFLILALASWVIISLRHITYNLSIGHSMLISRETLVKYWYVTLPLLLIIWAFLSVFWAENKFVSIFRSVKLLEFFILYLYIIFKLSPLTFHSPRVLNSEKNKGIVSRGTDFSPQVQMEGNRAKIAPADFLKNVVWAIFFLGLANSLVAIAQFATQHSVGLVFLRESFILPDLPGVAKVIIGGHKLIRSYGLFPHPNILGGFLLFSVMLNFALLKGKLFFLDVSHETNILNAVEKITLDKKRSTWNILQNKRKAFLYFALFTQLCALVFTFSKSAFLGLFIAFFYLLIKNSKNLKSAFDKAKIPILVVGIILVLLFFFFRVNLDSFFSKSINDRMDQFKVYSTILNFTGDSSHPVNSGFVSRGTKPENEAGVEQFGQFIYGLGAGQYVLEIYRKFGNQLEWWQYQPIHNVFLLIFVELGLIGFLIFIAFIFKLIFSGDFKMFHSEKCPNVPRGTFGHHGAGVEHFSFLRDGTSIILLMKATLLGFVCIMLFDHYFWDIQQGQIIIWLVAAIIISLRQRSMAQSAHH